MKTTLAQRKWLFRADSNGRIQYHGRAGYGRTSVPYSDAIAAGAKERWLDLRAGRVYLHDGQSRFLG